MAGSKVLVLGATGPAGICLLRECLYRNHETVAFVRNPSKIPADLVSNPLLTVSGPPLSKGLPTKAN
jgi:putative NADH-flavin reductase